MYLVIELKKISDYTSLFSELSASGRALNAVLIGTSFIAMEAVSYFVEKGARALIVGRSSPFEGAFGKEVAAKVRHFHESKGVAFLVDEDFGVKEFRGLSSRPGALAEIELWNGQVIACDVCLLAVGARPCTEFLEGTEVALTAKGLIAVDEFMRTSVGGVYAAGDNVSFPRSCLTGLFESGNREECVDIGHWGVANSQGSERLEN